MVGFLSGLSLSSAACKDQGKCTEALETARKAMQDQYLDMALARQWRDHAGGICGAGPELEGLDKEILAKEAALVKAAEDKAKLEADNGKKAMEAAVKLYAAFDALEEEKRTEKALSKTRAKITKMVKGLTGDYAKQVTKFNTAEFNKRKKLLKKEE